MPDSDPAERPLRTITTAPDAYDGFGTATLALLGLYRGQSVRLVATPPEHGAWQRARYDSGLHFAWTEEQWEKWSKEPWFAKDFFPTAEE
jgi:hypothetical protein